MDPTQLKEETSAWKIPIKQFEPQLELEKAINDLRIDYKAKGFSEEKLI